MQSVEGSVPVQVWMAVYLYRCGGLYLYRCGGQRTCTGVDGCVPVQVWRAVPVQVWRVAYLYRCGGWHTCTGVEGCTCTGVEGGVPVQVWRVAYLYRCGGWRTCTGVEGGVPVQVRRTAYLYRCGERHTCCWPLPETDWPVYRADRVRPGAAQTQTGDLCSPRCAGTTLHCNAHTTRFLIHFSTLIFPFCFIQLYFMSRHNMCIRPIGTMPFRNWRLKSTTGILSPIPYQGARDTAVLNAKREVALIFFPHKWNVIDVHLRIRATGLVFLSTDNLSSNF